MGERSQSEINRETRLEWGCKLGRKWKMDARMGKYRREEERDDVFPG